MKIIDRLKLASQLFFKGWTRPLASDETIWQGTPWWGASGTDKLENPIEQVNQNKSWVYICVNYNAKAISSIPLRLYTNKGSQAKKRYRTNSVGHYRLEYLEENPTLQDYFTKDVEVEEIETHPFLDMLKAVNPVMNQSDMWMLTETYMGLTGNCYWWIRPSKLDVPYQLWFLEPQYTEPVPGKGLDKFIAGYVFRRGIDEVPFDADEVVHHKYPNPKSRYLGMSPLQGLASAVSINEKMAKYDEAVFKNMARPEGVLESDEMIDDTRFKQIRKLWNQRYGGADKAGKIAILPDGFKYKSISMKPSELHHIEGKKYTREEIADGFGIPMALLSPDKVNLANAKIAYNQYMRDTVRPKLRLYEQKLNEQLLPIFDESLFVAFDDPVPADKEARRRDLEIHLKTGYSTINEERQKDGEDEVDWGEVPILDSRLMPFMGGQESPERQEEEEQRLAMRIAEQIYNKL